ncbi:urokinase plasminogen activator surface receptor-like [Rhinatrema bivittatum]|uniref:urokinase plasminogen activator surface receptor-like n=1 Tax=Rhinatrema bivittatum TaxID=194408 RepID=UPI00112E8BE0|nr:urokinase plasminogen activator surface receptor-like [Rhinatrema bivittatum]
MKCCDSSLCNDGTTDSEQPDLPLNGLQCYGCTDSFGQDCSPQNVDKVQCYGFLTTCLEVSIGQAPGQVIIMKGCATPAMCKNFIMDLYQGQDISQIRCCNESLCNDKIIPALQMSTTTQASQTSNMMPLGGIVDMFSSGVPLTANLLLLFTSITGFFITTSTC